MKLTKRHMITASNGNIFPRYRPFVRGLHRSPVNSPHKGQWRGALLFSLICPWINDWVNKCETGDLRRHRAHCDVTVMTSRDLHYIHRPSLQGSPLSPPLTAGIPDRIRSIKSLWLDYKHLTQSSLKFWCRGCHFLQTHTGTTPMGLSK